MINLKNLNEYPSTSFLSIKDLLDEAELNGKLLSELEENAFYVDAESLIEAHDKSSKKPGSLREYMTERKLTNKIRFHLRLTVAKNSFFSKGERACYFLLYPESGHYCTASLGILEEELSNVRVLT